MRHGLLVAADRSTLTAMQTLDRIAADARQAVRVSSRDAVALEALGPLPTNGKAWSRSSTEDGAATLDIALDLASRMRRPRLTVCHVYFNDAAIMSDEWERREAERRRRALELLPARAPCGDGVVETCVIQCPDVQRARSRPEMPAEFDLLVTQPSGSA